MPDLYFLIEFPIFRDFDGNDIDALAALCEELSLKPGRRWSKRESLRTPCTS